MTRTPPLADAPLEALLGALDEAIGLQQEVRAHLEATAEAVSRLDEAALRDRMDHLAPMAARLEEAGRRRHRARVRLAETLGRPVAEVTLGRLEATLPPPEADRIGRRRRQLRDLGRAVRDQHLRTAVLVGQAARINRSLLSAVIPTAAEAGTYESNGSRDPRAGRAMLDARR